MFNLFKINWAKNLLFFGVLLFSFPEITAQDTSIFEALGKIPNHEVTLELDFNLMEDVRKKDQTFPAKLSYQNENGETQSWEVKLSVRGRYRRMNCEMPPLKINFSKADLRTKNLANFDDLKWVTHCFEESSSDGNVLREYLAYCFYQEITPQSYRTQLLKVTYVNRAKPNQKVLHFAFVIEEDAEISKRLQVKECKDCFTIGLDSLDARSENYVAVFQYMIGNTDWSISRGQKNVKYFKPLNGDKIMAIPYDFDFSGFVGAEYAIPATGTNISTVKQRAFLGLKADKSLFEETIAHFRTKQNTFVQSINTFPYLKESDKKELIRFLNSFFSKDAGKLLK